MTNVTIDTPELAVQEYERVHGYLSDAERAKVRSVAKDALNKGSIVAKLGMAASIYGYEFNGDWSVNFLRAALQATGLRVNPQDQAN